MNKKNKVLLSTLSLVLFILTIAFFQKIQESYTYALAYYDLRFEKISEEIERGEYTISSEVVRNASKDKGSKDVDFKAVYTTEVSKTLSNDEKDAITQVLGKTWNKKESINNQIPVAVDGGNYGWVETRPVYKVVKGKVTRFYEAWSKSEEITIKIPIDVEYKINQDAKIPR